MEKLIIALRNNWKDGFYIKFKANEKAIRIIKKISEDLGSDYFVDNQIIPKILNYDKWRDQWIPIFINETRIDIVIGNRFVHMIVTKCRDFEIINKILDKYCEWAQPRYKKGFNHLSTE